MPPPSPARLPGPTPWAADRLRIPPCRPHPPCLPRSVFSTCPSLPLNAHAPPRIDPTGECCIPVACQPGAPTTSPGSWHPPPPPGTCQVVRLLGCQVSTPRKSSGSRARTKFLSGIPSKPLPRKLPGSAANRGCLITPSRGREVKVAPSNPPLGVTVSANDLRSFNPLFFCVPSVPHPCCRPQHSYPNSNIPIFEEFGTSEFQLHRALLGPSSSRWLSRPVARTFPSEGRIPPLCDRQLIDSNPVRSLIRGVGIPSNQFTGLMAHTPPFEISLVPPCLRNSGENHAEPRDPCRHPSRPVFVALRPFGPSDVRRAQRPSSQRFAPLQRRAGGLVPRPHSPF